MISGIDYNRNFGLKIDLLFIFIVGIAFALIALLANAIFRFPPKILYVLYPVALLCYFFHFDLLNAEKENPYLEAAPPAFRWISRINQGIVRLFPSIEKQQWHKHRALLLIGPAATLVSLLGAISLGFPFSWPLVLVCAFSAAAGYYSISALPTLWLKIESLWDELIFYWRRP